MSAPRTPVRCWLIRRRDARALDTFTTTVDLSDLSGSVEHLRGQLAGALRAQGLVPTRPGVVVGYHLDVATVDDAAVVAFSVHLDAEPTRWAAS